MADHVTYLDNPLPNENNHSRLWFIHKSYPLTEYDWYVARRLSVHWYYKKKCNCVYSAAVERKIKSIEDMI